MPVPTFSIYQAWRERAQSRFFKPRNELRSNLKRLSEVVRLMIVRRLADIVPEKVGDFKRWYLSKAETGHELSVRYIEVTGIVPPHSHYTEETLFYIEGRGLARIGEKEVAVKPGTMIVIPPGTVHSTIKEGITPLRYLALFVGNPDL